MDIIDFFRVEQKRLHDGLRTAVSDLTPDEWHYYLITCPPDRLPGEAVGPGTGNSIAFFMWHCVRTEDNILRFILQGRPPRWNEEGWHERLSLPPRVQGTGMATDEARALHIANIDLFMEYAEAVWREYEDYLATVQDGGAELGERVVTVKPLGELRAIQAIGQVCISHLFIHYGEIASIRGALGKKGQPI